jgi:hypothetical protein
MKNKLIFGYDILTYNGELPNCLNPKYVSSIFTASDFEYQNSGAFFSKRWNCDWAVYNSNFYEKYAEKKSIHQIKEDRKKGINYDWFYIMEPFANLEQFFGNHPIHEFALNFISKAALSEIKNGNGKLFFNYIIDGGIGIYLENFERVIKFLRDNEIPEEKVYFLFADFKLKSNFEKLGLKYKVFDYSLNMVNKAQEFTNVINNPDWRYWGKGAYEAQVGEIESTPSSIASSKEFIESIGKEKKDFLMLNRHWKLHRLLLLSHLHKLGLDKSLISWDNKFYHEDSISELLMHDNNPEFAKLVSETSSILDIQDLTKIAGYGFEDKNLYLNSYISLVTESIFFQCKIEANSTNEVFAKFPTGYISEKIWKPIGHCQPFILTAPAKSLKYIRERFGYKTFHPYIDESYDMECDDFARLRLIQTEIDKFTNKTKEEKDEFLNNVKDICVYNQNLFLEYGKNSWRSLNYNKEMQLILNFLLDGELEIVETLI